MKRRSLAAVHRLNSTPTQNCPTRPDRCGSSLSIRIDTKLPDKAETDDPKKRKQDAAEELRQVVATIGKAGLPGEHVRCVVSVSMLTEGWDANNVTHILGLRLWWSDYGMASCRMNPKASPRSCRSPTATSQSAPRPRSISRPRELASAGFRLESSAAALFYARNDHMGLTIPYKYMGIDHAYEPDFLVRLRTSVTVVLEIKGFEDDQTKAKHTAARRWVEAVNNWGQLGRWVFHVCRNPQLLDKEMEYLAAT